MIHNQNRLVAFGNIIRITTEKLVTLGDVLIKLGDTAIQFLWAEGFLLDKGRNIRVLHDFLDQILIMKTARLTFEYGSDTFHLISSFF